MRAGERNGQGTCNYSNGDVYEGEWKDGMPWNGQGKMTESDGSVYEGEWKDGKKWTGTFYYPIAQDRSQKIEKYKEGKVFEVIVSYLSRG